MNKLEEPARFNVRYGAINEDPNGQFIEYIEHKRIQQNTLTLDSKIKDGEIVEEPKPEDYEIKANVKCSGWKYLPTNDSRYYDAVSYDKALEEYQNHPNIRECLKELEEFNKSKIKLSIYKENKIEQLTKERDALKFKETKALQKYNKCSEDYWDKEKQLQAEKKKVKEMRDNFCKFLDRVGDALEGNNSHGYLSIEADEIQELLNQ